MDLRLFRWMNGVDWGPVGDALAGLASSSGLGLALGLVALGGLLLWRRDRAAVGLALAVALAVGVTDLTVGKGLKPAFARPRPCHAMPATARLHGTQCGGTYGFPSSHAANTAAIVAVLFGQAPTAVVGLFGVLTVFVGWSRVYVGAHYPGDVLAGIVFGAFVGWLVRRLLQQASLRLQRSGSAIKL